jgi:hypothetical protein
VQLGRCGSGRDSLALGALGFGDHFGRALRVTEGQQVRVLSEAARDVMVKRNDLAVDDGIVALGAVVVGVLDHDLRIGQSSSRVGVADDLGYLFGEWAVGLVFADERYAEKIVMQLEVLELDAGQAECEQAGVERHARSSLT